MINITDESKNTDPAVEEVIRNPEVKALVIQGDPSSIPPEGIQALVQAKRIELIETGRKQLDLGKATHFAAFSGVLKDLDDSAHAAIKLRKEDGAAGALAGAADMVATLLRSINRNSDLPLISDVPDESVEPKTLDESVELPELVPGATFIGVENLSPDDFLTSPSDE